ncbi:hypothetical protein ETD83_40320 [Actinomadura soli]|uniref:Uncharacterized protein n=1 Tax=Actinomadura soli TaxID=2508997 RepID=A0A5C4IYR8_9ACTN|nr:hypothetical protein [Actinomadura soli]TMQ86151.1 hypothetical protein ETD83_40320 [Actinomadura soli]
MIRDPISRGARHRRDKLVVTGIPPVVGPETPPPVDPVAGTAPTTETWPVTETGPGWEPGPGVETELETELETATGAQTATSPVFVDSTGWRARLGRRFGLAAGAVLIVFLGALGIGMATGPDVPFTPWKEPSGRPGVELSRPPGPTKKPDDQRAAGRPGSAGGGEGAAPAVSGSSAPSSARPAPPTATSRPGRSEATPPAWGRKKKSN